MSETKMSKVDARAKVAAGVGVATLLAIGAGLLWPEDAEPAPREREYTAQTACLLTDDKALVGDTAKTVWSGMRDASLASRIKVQYLAVTGPQTTANALSYFNSLGVRKCTIIVAVGSAPVDAMVAGHAQFPNSEHVAVGGARDTAGITVLADTPLAGVRPGIAKLIAGGATAAG